MRLVSALEWTAGSLNPPGCWGSLLPFLSQSPDLGAGEEEAFYRPFRKDHAMSWSVLEPS